jgi:7-keto-8-aminopelargonate synthetase-like enzyme
MSLDAKNLSLAEKRKLAQQLLSQRKAQASKSNAEVELPDYTRYTYDMYMFGSSPEPSEIEHFDDWVQATVDDRTYTFEVPRLQAQLPENDIYRASNERLHVVNLSSYNYLGYGYHPKVIAAAKEALDIYGLGAASSPVASGTFGLHKQLESRLIEFFDLPDYGVSLFSSGYGVNSGTISAYMKQGGHIIMDRSVHMSILEGAQLSHCTLHYFNHNDVDHLEAILQDISRAGPSRMLVCVEGVYSADGDYSKVGRIVEVAKRYDAKVLVDEAHSMLLTGPHGRGLCANQGVLQDVDLLVMTFSKAFGGVGGALFAPRKTAQYVNWYAKCRMFSCALDPAVTGGIIKSLELASGSDGDERRRRLRENTRFLRAQLQGKVNTGSSESWIVPVIYGPEKYTLPLSDYVQRSGLDTSVMQFPAVGKNESRMRLFVTSEHSTEQLRRAAEIIIRAAHKYGFALDKEF